MITGGGHPDSSGAPEPTIGPATRSGVSSANTSPEPTLLDVVRVLSDTYDDAGIVRWLTSNRDSWGFNCALDFIEDGRTAEVLAAAKRIEAGS